MICYNISGVGGIALAEGRVRRAMPMSMRKYAPLVPLIVALALVAALAANRSLHEAALEADYVSFFTAGKMISMGYGSAAQLYDHALQANTQQAILAGSGIRHSGGLLPFVNPPFTLFIFTPLSYLPAEDGFLLWNIIQMAALVLAPQLLQTMLPLITVTCCGWE